MMFTSKEPWWYCIWSRSCLAQIENNIFDVHVWWVWGVKRLKWTQKLNHTVSRQQKCMSVTIATNIQACLSLIMSVIFSLMSIYLDVSSIGQYSPFFSSFSPFLKIHYISTSTLIGQLANVSNIFLSYIYMDIAGWCMKWYTVHVSSKPKKKNHQSTQICLNMWYHLWSERVFSSARL